MSEEMLKPIYASFAGGEQLALNDAARAALFVEYRDLRFTFGGEEEFLRLFRAINPTPSPFVADEPFAIPTVGDRDTWREFAAS